MSQANKIYQYLTQKLLERAEKKRGKIQIERNKARVLLGRHMIPKALQVSLLAEMGRLGLIDTRNKRVIIILWRP